MSQFSPSDYPVARLRVPARPGLYWVIPAGLDFPVRVMLHRRPRDWTDARAIELLASGQFVTGAQAVGLGWEWFAQKPEREPPPRDLVDAVVGDKARAGWAAAARAVQAVLLSASELACECSLVTPGTRDPRRREDLCLACRARDAQRLAAAAP